MLNQGYKMISLNLPVIYFDKIKKCEDELLKIDNLLEGPVCHSGFKRLN